MLIGRAGKLWSRGCKIQKDIHNKVHGFVLSVVLKHQDHHVETDEKHDKSFKLRAVNDVEKTSMELSLQNNNNNNNNNKR